MSTLPVYVVTGFLSTGKTHFINDILSNRYSSPTLIQFEDGLQQSRLPALQLTLSDEDTINAKDLTSLALTVIAEIERTNSDELWIEWNGMQSFSLLERLCYETPLSSYVHLQQVFYLTTEMYTLTMLGKTGEPNLSQLANADIAVVLGDHPLSAQLVATLHSYHPRLKLRAYQPGPETATPNDWFKHSSQSDRRQRQLFTSSYHYQGWSFAGSLLLLLFTGGFIYQAMPANTLPLYLDRLITIFLGIFLQAFPFLILGVIISSAIQFFLAPSFIDKFLAGNRIKGTIFALIGGFFFPVCDCATIPIFRSLLIRQVPVPIGITFMLSSPIINPIVLLSTYYAFAGNYHVVLARLGLGALAAILIGLSFYRYTGLSNIQRMDTSALAFQNMYLTGSLHRHATTRWQSFFIHTQSEFFKMGSYLLIGALISSGFQVYIAPIARHLDWLNSLPVAILAMMLFAFLLSLCSTSDAMIARSLGSFFPLPALIGFLLLGPMMDLKNFFMLNSILPRDFVMRLLCTSIVVVFFCSLGFAIIST